MRRILGLVLILNALWLIPELIPTPDLNDNVLHATLINGMVRTIENRGNPFDFYTPEIGLGQDIIKYYQPGAHFIVAALYFALFKLVPVATVFLWVKFLSLALLPLTFWFVAGMLELSPAARLSAAALAPLISGDSFGIDYGSYVWAGIGLFPQAIATHFLLLSIGFGWQAMKGRTWMLPAGALILTGWSNLLYGYLGALIISLMAIVTGRKSIPTVVKIGAAGLAGAAPKLWVWISAGQSTGEAGARAFMSDSYGAEKVLRNLFTGQLFDAGRAPVVTVLVLLGIVLIVRTKERQILLWGFALMLAVYFGRPFWGNLLYLIGITPSMPLHRLIGPVQIFGVLLAAIALARIREITPRPYGLLAVALILAIPIQERSNYLSLNAEWAGQTRQAFAKDGPDIEQALAIAQARGGRAYAGMPYSWGIGFRIGSVPVYSLFPVRGIPCVGYLYIGFSPRSASTYTFQEQPAQFRDFDIRTVIAPKDRPKLPNTDLIATYGRFAIYAPK
jgi:hypothetical protein